MHKSTGNWHKEEEEGGREGGRKKKRGNLTRKHMLQTPQKSHVSLLHKTAVHPLLSSAVTGNKLNRSCRARGLTAVVPFSGPEYGHRSASKKVKPDSWASHFSSHFCGQKAVPKSGPAFRGHGSPMQKRSPCPPKEAQPTSGHVAKLCRAMSRTLQSHKTTHSLRLAMQHVQEHEGTCMQIIENHHGYTLCCKDKAKLMHVTDIQNNNLQPSTCSSTRHTFVEPSTDTAHVSTAQ